MAENSHIEWTTHTFNTPEMPERMRRLQRDPERPHFPVPWFVAWIDGKPDFRCIESGRIVEAVRFQRCWLCGQRLGSVKSFVIGPMCAVNRVSSEPPSHTSCSEYAVKVCPFLTQPRMKRNEKGLPEERKEPAGLGIKRNPGCALVWNTTKFSPFRVGDGVLFRVGTPYSLSWWAEGRAATRAEVLASIESGLPLLRQSAEAEGPEAVAELERLLLDALKLVPDAEVN